MVEAPENLKKHRRLSGDSDERSGEESDGRDKQKRAGPALEIKPRTDTKRPEIEILLPPSQASSNKLDMVDYSADFISSDELKKTE